MARAGIVESTVECAALAWLSELGWQVKHGTEFAPDGLFAERQDFGQVVLEQRLRDALLPKLIRGEIRVKDAERFLKECAL
jgi:type I restriction enzyme R subunit